MKNLLFTFLFLIATTTYSQSTILPSELVNEFVQSSSFTDDILIEVLSSSNGFFDFKLVLADKSKTFKIKPLSLQEFENKLSSSLSAILTEKQITLNSSKNLQSVKHLVSFVYGQLITELRIENTKPKIATVSLRNDISIFLETDKSQENSLGSLTDVKADLTFYDGFIEKIKVVGKFNNEELVFRNAYSIGISSVNNIKSLYKVKLYSMKSHKIMEESKSKNAFYVINVGDVIKYDEVIDINSNDLSPESILVNLTKDNESVELFKEETTKLFEAQIYSDLLGMFDEENPNGIIQTEVKKRFNIHTQRHDVSPILSWAFRGFGVAQYFEAFFEFSKIEKNNKFLSPQNNLNDLEPTTELNPFFTPISLFQYRTFAIGGNLNLLTLENTNTKMNFTLDAGYLFGRSGIKDFGETTTAEEIDDTENTNFEEKFLNNMEVPIEAKLILLPEKRLNFTVSNRLSWFETFDDNINLSSVEENVNVSKNRWLNTFTAGINLNLSSSGRLFVRYKITHEFDNINTNFSRLQFGYSFYLLQNNESKNPTEKFSN